MNNGKSLLIAGMGRGLGKGRCNSMVADDVLLSSCHVGHAKHDHSTEMWDFSFSLLKIFPNSKVSRSREQRIGFGGQTTWTCVRKDMLPEETESDYEFSVDASAACKASPGKHLSGERKFTII